jgi:hypothetical protein
MLSTMSEESPYEVLKKQDFGPTTPGTVLADFQALLDFVGDGIPTSGKNGRLPMALLYELDSRMTHPLQPKLKRPLQLTFPHLNGLMLLLKQSGLCRLSGHEDTGRIAIPPIQREAWQSLNPTEQYFTLLQSFLDANWNLVDSERQSGHGPMLDLRSIVDYWSNRKSEAGPSETPAPQLFYGWSRQTSAALLELLGILAIERVEPRDGENWRIASIKVTNFGQAFMARMTDGKHADFILRLIMGKITTNNEWVGDLFREFFPECLSTLPDNIWDFVDGIWQFKVTIEKAWRRIQVPATSTLDELAQAILEAFDFEQDTGYAFRVPDRSGRVVEIYSEHEDDNKDTAILPVGALPLDPEMFITLCVAVESGFLFSDEMLLSMELEKILRPNPKITKAQVTAKRGK